MKHAFKTLWLVVAALFILGAVLAAVGMAAGASRRIQLTPHGVELGAPGVVYVEKSERNTGAFTNMDLAIPVTWTRIDVAYSSTNSYGYEVKVPSSAQHDLDCSVKNGTLTIEPRDKHAWGALDLSNLGEINLDWRNRGYDEGRIVVYVPRGVALDTVQLSLAAGDYAVGDLDARNVSVTCPAGTVRMGRITANRVALSAQAGSMRVAGVTADTLIETVTAGELTSLESSASVVSLSVATGTLRFEGDAKNQLTAKIAVGEGQLSLARGRDAYALTSEVAAGEISINGRSAGQTHEIYEDRTQLKVSVATGEARLSFQ